MFLFSGTFFPVEELPAPLEVIAYLTPLWHGVELCRMLTLGDVDLLPALGHLAYLLACIAVGLAAALYTYRKRLVL
jgi:lipooligosaccharide transport system permease protein